MQKLVKESMRLQNRLLGRCGDRVEYVRKESIVTQSMLYDTIDDSSLREKFKEYEDYTRYRTFELVVDEIRKRYTPEELSRFCVAEAGVFKGRFSWIINEKFPECEMFLYDTFEGFAEDDLADELNRAFTDEQKLVRCRRHFGNPAEGPERRIGMVKSKLKHEDKCHIRKGYFPDSADGERDKEWVFVSLDMDLYHPMREGLFYFWPNMVEGGIIFVHDYNNKDFAGIKVALSEAEEEFGRIHRVPISDQGGTMILCK